MFAGLQAKETNDVVSALPIVERQAKRRDPQCRNRAALGHEVLRVNAEAISNLRVHQFDCRRDRIETFRAACEAAQVRELPSHVLMR
jgi:hypothetical protein